jgi:hypothetical protein
MTDVGDQPASLEDINAGLLNGAMVTLLGCAIAGVLAWQIIGALTGRLPDLTAMAVDLPAYAPRRFNFTGLVLLVASLGAIRWGVRHVRENLTRLRARKG